MLPFCSENCGPFQLRHAHVIKDAGLSPHIHVPAWESLGTKLDTKTCQCDVLFYSTSLPAGTTRSGFGMLAALKVSLIPRPYPQGEVLVTFD